MGNVLPNSLRKTSKKRTTFMSSYFFYSNYVLHFHCSKFLQQNPVEYSASPKGVNTTIVTAAPSTAGGGSGGR